MNMAKLTTAQKCMKHKRGSGKGFSCLAFSPVLLCSAGLLKQHDIQLGSGTPTQASACRNHARDPNCSRGTFSILAPFLLLKHWCKAYRLCRSVRLGHTQDTVCATAHKGTFLWAAPSKAPSSSRMNWRRSSSAARRLTSRMQCHVTANQTKRNHTMHTADESTK